MIGKVKNQWIGLLAALFVFAMNLKIMAPTITAGDSAELSAAQTVLGIAHSPGYPLYVLAGKMFQTLVPFGAAAYKTNLFSAVLSGLCAMTCYWIVMTWSGSCLLSVSSALLIASMPVIRDQFVVTEVFALNFLILLILIYCCSNVIPAQAGRFLIKTKETTLPHQSSVGIQAERREPSAKMVFLICFLLGAGLGNQHTLILFIPSMAVILHGIFGKECVRLLPSSAFFFLLGLSVYIFLPIRAFRMPYLSWEDPRTLERIWGVVSRARYGTFQLAQGTGSRLSVSLVWNKTIFFVSELRRQIPFGGAFMCLGLMLIPFFAGNSARMSFSLLLYLVLAGPFFLSLSNVDTVGSAREIIMRFLPMPCLAFLLLGFLGASRMPDAAKIIFAFVFLALSWRMASAPSLRENYLVYDLGRSLLKTLPDKAILFADRADEAEFSLAYLLYCERRKWGLEFIDCNAGVTPSIYGEDYYKIWGKPRLEIRQVKEKEMIEKAPCPVYYATVDPDMIPIPRIAQGLLFQAKPVPGKGNPVPWDEFYALRLDLQDPGFRGVSLLASSAQLMGRYFLDTSQFEKSDRCFHLLSLSSPQDVWSHSVALLYLNAGNLELSEKYFQKALASGLEKDKVLCNLGALYEKEGRMRSAEESYKRALDANPDNYQAHYNLGVLYWKENRWDQVVNEFKSVLSINPQYPSARRFLEIAIRRQTGL